MATKKTLKSSKTKTHKTTKSAPIDHNHFGKCFIALGLVMAGLLFGLFYYMGQSKTFEEKQKLLAFDGLASSYLDAEFYTEGERAATITDSGITEDNDLYYDFVITTFSDHVPMTTQKARLHFQCHEEDSLKLKDGCSYAYWYDDIAETSSAYREKAHTFYEITENYTNAINTAETESQKAALQAEYKKFYESYADFNWLGLE